jgi:hypothetical protein
MGRSGRGFRPTYVVLRQPPASKLANLFRIDVRYHALGLVVTQQLGGRVTVPAVLLALCRLVVHHRSVDAGLTPGYTSLRFPRSPITYRCGKVSMKLFARLALLGVVCLVVAVAAVSQLAGSGWWRGFMPLGQRTAPAHGDQNTDFETYPRLMRSRG